MSENKYIPGDGGILIYNSDISPKLGWIKCSDKLPDKSNRVLTFRCNYIGDIDNKINVGYLGKSNKFYGNMGELLDDDLYPHTFVSHWMPLPNPPIE